MGILNLAWHDACAACLKQLTKAERDAGWPESFRLWPLALLQRPYTPGTPRARWPTEALYQAMTTACDLGQLSYTTTEIVVPTTTTQPRFVNRQTWDGMHREVRQVLVCTTKAETAKCVTAQAFAAWLAAQGEEPSVHIKAWFAAAGVVNAQAVPVTAPEAAQTAPVAETARERQDRRLKDCETAELVMPASEFGRLPNGVAKIAQQEGVSRQAFSRDVKAAIARRAALTKPDRLVHRT